MVNYLMDIGREVLNLICIVCLVVEAFESLQNFAAADQAEQVIV